MSDAVDSETSLRSGPEETCQDFLYLTAGAMAAFDTALAVWPLIDGERIAGALRDSVLVPRNASVTLAFDADNPGRWAFHCHHLYHMTAGMMTSMEYIA